MKLNYFFRLSVAMFLLLFFFQASGQTVAITYVRDITTGTDPRLIIGLPNPLRLVELRVKVSGVSSPVNVAAAQALRINLGDRSLTAYDYGAPVPGAPAIWQFTNWVNESSTQASFAMWVPVNSLYSPNFSPILEMRIGQGRKTGIFGTALEIVYATGSVQLPPLYVPLPPLG